jgi:cytochrome d ubiquinol oxidase subunit I
MSDLDLARWQFGITTVYHFLFVPLTISLAFIVAGFQTAWVRSGNDKYLKLTRFYGELFLINFAMGVATGIVQEFQFGMNWSNYSRFVGDIFGAPLAIEGLLAFFLESTFLGMWIFGWDRLPRKVHLASIWLAAIGTLLSAYFILAANAWMQQPVGFAINTVSGRAELKDFIAVLTNPTVLLAVPHVIAASFITGGAFVLGVAVWRVVRRPEDAEPFRTAAKVGAVTVLIAGLAVLIVGDQLGKHLATDQPMKAAASEGIYETAQPAPFTVAAIWGPDGKMIPIIQIPNLLSFLETNDFNAKVEGINQIQAQYQAMYPQYGDISYSPFVPVTFWSFRLMIGAGGLAALAAIWFLWVMRKGRTPGRGAILIATLLPFLPLAANSLGWLLNEMGRQPWIVQGYTGAMILITLIGFTLLYGALAVVEVGLLRRSIASNEPILASDGEGDSSGHAMNFSY